MREVFTSFSGRLPRLQPRYLPVQNATEAFNTRLETGAIEPFREATQTSVLAIAAQSFFLWRGEWLGFADAGIHAVEGPVATDRLYITGQAEGPVMRYQATDYSLGVPRPSGAPTLAITGTATDPASALLDTILYAYSYVTDLDEESAMSDLSNPETISPGQSSVITGYAAPPAGRRIDRIRIYRSVTGTQGVTALYYVDEIPATDTTYTHDIIANPIVETAPNIDYDAPPNDMQGLVYMPNGMMAAFAGKEVLFCEPYLPHTWPDKYKLTVTDDIVGLAVFGSTLAVMTTGTPVIIEGLQPDTMAMTKSDEELPCLAAEGIVDLGYAAAYPSTDGLVVLSSNGGQIITLGTFTKRQWEALNPATFHAARLEGRYVFSHIDPDTTQPGLGLIDLRGDNPFYSTLDGDYADLRFDVPTGKLYGLDTDGVTVREIDGVTGTPLSYQWRSKVLHYEYPVQYGAIRVDANADHASPAVTIEVYADNVLIQSHDRVNEILRLPHGIRAREWQVRIGGTYTVTDVIIAGSPSELAGVA